MNVLLFFAKEEPALLQSKRVKQIFISEEKTCIKRCNNNTKSIFEWSVVSFNKNIYSIHRKDNVDGCWLRNENVLIKQLLRC